MKIEYIHTAYDFIDNGAGELMLIIGMSEGEADEENAKFVYDGFAEAMLVRNSGQIVHLPIVVEGVRDMLEEIKTLLVTEMAPRQARQSRVDEKNLQGVAHNDSLQDEQMREGFSLSSAPGDDIYDSYEAPIEILNKDLPLPQEVRNGLLKNHIIEG